MGKWLIRSEKITKTYLLKKTFSSGKGQQVQAVDNVNLAILPGTVFGLVGESGCGKSTLGRLLVGLEKPDKGEILFRDTNLWLLSGTNRSMLKKEMQIIFQDPADSFNPRWKIKQVVSEGMDRFFNKKTRKWRNDKIMQIVEAVKLRPEMMNRYPHELSGGERQRVGIARSLILEPEFLVCDEPVSSLDVSVQAEILNLLLEIRERFNLTYLFISHDLSVVQYMSTEVAVMYLGRIVEQGKNEEIFENPCHPYTQALFAAVPSQDKHIQKEKLKIPKGNVPDPLHIPEGCPFHPRCLYKIDICVRENPLLEEISPEHTVACHLY